MVAIDHAIERSGLKIVECMARVATGEEILRVHGAAHLEALHAARGKRATFDPDTRASPGSVEAAELAAGGTIDLALGVAKGELPPGLALIRPPGHHATRDRMMGFCMLNNVAIAAEALRANGLAERIAIYDFDVHHGNGTEAIFYEDPNVFYLSTHQWPLYPGTGPRHARGRGRGEGTTLNAPLPEGTNDETIVDISREALIPAVESFAPDFMLLSMGFDAHIDDPLGGFALTARGFRELTLLWRDLAERVSKGRIAGVLEGGYDLDALGASVVEVLDGWAKGA